jgi:hypothetical protein
MVIPYGELVTVTLAGCRSSSASEDTCEGCPTSFTWRGRRYWVSVLATWRLCTRWWCLSQEPTTRTYYRVLGADQQLFELSYDHVSGAWVLGAVLG